MAAQGLRQAVGLRAPPNVFKPLRSVSPLRLVNPIHHRVRRRGSMENTYTHNGVIDVVKPMFIAALPAVNRDSLSHLPRTTAAREFARGLRRVSMQPMCTELSRAIGKSVSPSTAESGPTGCVGSTAIARDRPLTADCARAPATPKAAAQRRIEAVAIARRLAPSRAVPDNGRVTEEGAVMGHSSTATGGQNELHAHLLRMVYGGQVAQTVYVAAKLGLPDLLAAGSRTTSELATRATIEEPTMRRLLRGLSALGLCCEVETER